MTDEQLAPLLAGFPEVTTIPVQWGDQDAFGHVNNTIFIRWFEIGRIAYLRRIGMAHGVGGLTTGPILAAVACSFRKQVSYPDVVRVGSRISRVGKSSLVMDHVVASEAQLVIVADGSSTIVHYDYTTGASSPVPDSLRRAIAEVEGQSRG